MKRFLAFIDYPPGALLQYLKLEDCSDIILRKFSYGTEIDFHCCNPDIVVLLTNKFEIQRFEEFDEESDTYRPEKRQHFLNRESVIVAEANELISSERYWQSHTLLENLWKAYDGSIKKYFQGIILVSAAMTQFQMGNPEAAHSLYKRARRLLEESGRGAAILEQIPEDFTYPVFFKI